MSAAAYLARLSVGSSPVFATGAATLKTNTQTRTISNPLRRVFDPKQSPAPVVRNGTTVLDPSTYSINYPDGIITFADALSGSPNITVDYAYVPLLEIGGAESYTIDVGADLIEDTSFEQTNKNGGYKSRRATLMDASISMDQYTHFEDNPLLAQPFIDRLFSREPVFIEILPSGGNIIRGWFIIESDNSTGAVADLEKQGLSFQLSNISNSNFSWRS